MILFIVQLNQFYQHKLQNIEKLQKENSMNKEINNVLLEMKLINF